MDEGNLVTFADQFCGKDHPRDSFFFPEMPHFMQVVQKTKERKLNEIPDRKTAYFRFILYAETCTSQDKTKTLPPASCCKRADAAL